ncbi:MAG: sensor domain-containing diguanylate cyclase [Agarilytica sp.]
MNKNTPNQKSSRSALAQARDECELLSAINNVIELEELLEIFGQQIDKLGLFDAYLINLVDDTGENLVCEKIRLPKGYESIESTYFHYNFSLDGDFVNVDSYKRNDAITIDRASIQGYEPHVRTRFERWKIHQLIVVPIPATKAGKSLGTIMAFRQDKDLAPESEKALHNAAIPFSPRIQAALKFNRLKDKQTQVDQIASEQTRFLEFVTTINNLTSTEDIYEAISKEFLRQLPFEHVSVMMKEGNKIMCKKNMVHNSHYQEFCDRWDNYLSNTPYKLDIADGATPTALLNNSHLLFPDVMKILHLPMSEKDRIGLTMLDTPRTFLFMPIRHANQAIGLIWLISFTKTVEISEEQLKLVELLCAFIGTSIKNAEVYDIVAQQKREIEQLNGTLQGKLEELAEIAATDKLTGLYNFRSFEQELERHISPKPTGQKANVALIIIDIDHFKIFNDTYGHNAGNSVLAGVAKNVSELARQSDIACRFGGEEFAVILPKCDEAGAEKFAQRIRTEIETTDYDTDAGPLKVTVSIGVGTHQAGDSHQHLFKRVDQALYRAKKLGRNRVETA